VSDGAPAAEAPRNVQKGDLAELTRLFLRLGFTAFGGPAAHIAMMKEEVVTRRQWLSEAEFLDLLGATNLIPGPNSTEMAIHIGLLRGGWRGLLLAGACFILPATLIVSAFAWAYARYGTLPQAEGLLYGVKPVIVAVIVQAIAGLVKPALKSRLLTVLAVAALGMALFLPVPEVALLFGAGAIAGAARWGQSLRREPPVEPAAAGTVAAEEARQDRGGLAGLLAVAAALIALPLLLTRLAVTRAAEGADGAAAFGLLPLFLFFLKTGSVLYGSGYVLLAFLRDGLVADWGWLNEAQLLDATAVGQVTPGPVFTTATFIGYVLGGPWAALVATLGIFLPSFVFVALSGKLVPRIRRSPLAGAFLDGVNAAALGLMAAVTFQLGHAALVDLVTVVMALASAVLLVRFKVNSVWLILAGLLLGGLTTYLSR
jgi:chromate transporter, chromate ion transporter (CHR) family